MNNNCPTEQQLSAYHDGELPSNEREQVAAHLAWCAACVRQLQVLGQMSGLMASHNSQGLSQIAWHRLHARLDEVMERGLIRWAWEVSAIAAAILVIASVWLTRLSEPQNSTASSATATAVVPPWVGAQTSADPTLNEVPSPAGVWYLADARNSSEVAP